MGLCSILFDGICENPRLLNEGDRAHVHSRGTGGNDHEEPHDQSEVMVLRRFVVCAGHASFLAHDSEYCEHQEIHGHTPVAAS